MGLICWWSEGIHSRNDLGWNGMSPQLLTIRKSSVLPRYDGLEEKQAIYPYIQVNGLLSGIRSLELGESSYPRWVHVGKTTLCSVPKSERMVSPRSTGNQTWLETAKKPESQHPKLSGIAAYGCQYFVLVGVKLDLSKPFPKNHRTGWKETARKKPLVKACKTYGYLQAISIKTNQIKVYKCIYIYINTHIPYIYIYIRVYIYIHTRTSTCIYICIYIYIRIYIYTYVYIYISTRTYTCIYIYTLCMYVYIYIHIHTQTHTHKTFFFVCVFLPALSLSLFLSLYIHKYS